MSKHDRRDFLRRAIGFSCGYVYLPSLATLIFNRQAFGSDSCSTQVDNDSPAFIGLDLRGGASIAGNNVIVYDDKGELLKSYEGLGLPSALHPQGTDKINTSIGLPMHADSAMLRGILQAPATVQANTNGVVICTRAQDDTSSNQLATAPGVHLAGANGSFAALVGTQASASGGNSITPFMTNAAPVRITDFSSGDAIASIASVWQQQPERMAKVITALNKLSFSQLEQFSNLGLSEQAVAMMKCGYLNAEQMLLPQEGLILNASQDTDVSSIVNFQQNPAATEIAYLVLKGYAGTGTITLSGYDYHDTTATTGDSRDYAAGQTIAMILAMAAALNRKLMLHVYTDGGVSIGRQATAVTGGGTQVEKFVWVGDSEMRAAAFVLVYDPDGRPSLTFNNDQRQQLGAYKNAGDGTINLQPSQHQKIAGDPVAQAQAVVANWLAWQGKPTTVQGLVQTPIGDIDDYIFIGG
ncbi:MAG: hypothetical protein OYH77_05105 [Pseudomonadota bacterium]|nr:hypothetical protein [Pseudomonadota bacterium]